LRLRPLRMIRAGCFPVGIHISALPVFSISVHVVDRLLLQHALLCYSARRKRQVRIPERVSNRCYSSASETFLVRAGAETLGRRLAETLSYREDCLVADPACT
jgi:hypothetical protein